MTAQLGAQLFIILPGFKLELTEFIILPLNVAEPDEL